MLARTMSVLLLAGLAALGIGVHLGGCSAFSEEAGGADAQAEGAPVSDAQAGDALFVDGGSEACPKFCDDFDDRTDVVGRWERTNSEADAAALALDPSLPFSGSRSLRVRVAPSAADKQAAYLIKEFGAPGQFTWTAGLRVNDAASIFRVTTVVTDETTAHQVGLRVDGVTLKLAVQHTGTRLLDVGPALVVGQWERVTVAVNLSSTPPRATVTRGSGQSFAHEMPEWGGAAAEPLTFRFGASFVDIQNAADFSLDAFQLAY